MTVKQKKNYQRYIGALLLSVRENAFVCRRKTFFFPFIRKIICDRLRLQFLLKTITLFALDITVPSAVVNFEMCSTKMQNRLMTEQWFLILSVSYVHIQMRSRFQRKSIKRRTEFKMKGLCNVIIEKCYFSIITLHKKKIQTERQNNVISIAYAEGRNLFLTGKRGPLRELLYSARCFFGIVRVQYRGTMLCQGEK